MSVVRWENMSAASVYSIVALYLHQAGAWNQGGAELFIVYFAQPSTPCLSSFL